MHVTTQQAWIVTGTLAVVFAGAYLFYFGPQYSQAAGNRQAAQSLQSKIDADWVPTGADAKPLKTVAAEIAQRQTQAYEDVNQVFNVPVVYQRPKVGENASTYFFNLLDHLKKNPATKGLLKDAKFGWDRFDPDNKYPAELKLRHLAMVDRVAKAAGASGLTEMVEFNQSSAQEITPESERSDAAGAGSRGGRRPGLGVEPAPGAVPAAAASPADGIRLVRVVMTVKFRGPEGGIVKFLSLLQTPSPDSSELTMVYLNSATLQSNDKTFGALDGEMVISAIFPLKDADLKAVLGTAGQMVLK